MNLKELFKRRPRPSTEGLQSVADKNPKYRPLKYPPVDENGRFIDDRPKIRAENQSAGMPSGISGDTDK
ncbi:MAG: hypothetical protein FWH47_07040 [Methanomassiliicoccaceae archaeon]|nr:hypothetical protein [Methanomassiliicoccaceae archaeon]